MKNTWFVIVNPAADSEKGMKHWLEIEQLLYELEVDFTSQITDKKGHAIEIAQHAIKSGYRKLFAVGGDGTINEVVNGIMTQTTVPTANILVGMASMGTGNDWIKTIGLSDNFKVAAKLMKTGSKTRTIDCGKVSYFEGITQHERYFVNIAGMGYDAFVTKDANENSLFKGKFQYIISVVKGLFKYDSTTVKVQLDDRIVEDRMFTLNVGNCKFAGGGMMIVPLAEPDDGVFHVTLIKDMSRMEVVKNLPGLFKGTFISHPQVECVPSRSVKVESDSPIYVEVEGEVLGHSPFEYTLYPGSIQVLVG